MAPWVAVATVLAGVANLALVPYLWGTRDRPGARWFVAVIGVQAYWGVTYGLALAVFDPGLRRLLEVATWLGPIWIGVCYIAFALAYTGRGHLLDRRWFAIPVGFGLLSTALVLTNPLHHIFWTGFAIEPVLGAATVTYAHGWWIYVQYLVTFGLATTGVFVLMETVASYGPRYRAQSIAIALTPVPPAAAFTLWAFQIGPIWQLNLTPLMFLPHLVLDAYALFREDLFEFPPATRRAGERAAIDDLATPVVIVDEAGRIVTENPAAASMLGVDRRDAFGRSLADIVPEFAADAAIDGERVERLVDGERRTYAVAASPLTDGAGERVGSTVTFQDVTGEIRRRQRLDVLNRVLRHNLRNDLGVVGSYATAAAEAADDEEVSSLLEPVEEKAAGLLELGEKARRAERLLSGESAAERVDICELLEAAIEEVSAEHPGAELSLSCPDGATAEVDRAALRAICTNLLENAAEHAGTSPRITASVEGVGAGGAAITIGDDGPGIPDLELDTLAAGSEDPLQHGSGLGLWMVQWLADSIGATVEFDTEEAGTRVTVTVPA